MRTKIVITSDMSVVDEYDFPLVLHKGDRVRFNGNVYVVDDCSLNVESKTILIFVDLYV